MWGPTHASPRCKYSDLLESAVSNGSLEENPGFTGSLGAGAKTDNGGLSQLVVTTVWDVIENAAGSILLVVIVSRSVVIVVSAFSRYSSQSHAIPLGRGGGCGNCMVRGGGGGGGSRPNSLSFSKYTSSSSSIHSVHSAVPVSSRRLIRRYSSWLEICCRELRCWNENG